jgi:hypothetical protein
VSQRCQESGHHASRIFQKLSLRTILPSSPNVQMSHPRTSTRTPSVMGPQRSAVLDELGCGSRRDLERMRCNGRRFRGHARWGRRVAVARLRRRSVEASTVAFSFAGNSMCISSFGVPCTAEKEPLSPASWARSADSWRRRTLTWAQRSRRISSSRVASSSNPRNLRASSMAARLSGVASVHQSREYECFCETKATTVLRQAVRRGDWSGCVSS